MPNHMRTFSVKCYFDQFLLIASRMEFLLQKAYLYGIKKNFLNCAQID